MSDTARPMLPDQAARECILRQLDTSLLVEAAAGTGKTTCMVGRMIRLLAEGKCGIGTLAAVTFTRKAAAELRGRFTLELNRMASAAEGEEKTRLTEALGRVEQCFIGTVHSFCGRLLRERPVEAGVDLEFQEMEEEADATLRDQAWSRMAARLYADGDSILDELDHLGLDLPSLKRAYESYVLYPDVEEWPAGKAALPKTQAIVDSICEYARDMERMVAPIEGDGGNDKLIPIYRRIPRLLRQTDLSRVSEVMELLAEFKPGKVVQKEWPDKKQAKAEEERMAAFVENQARPKLREWREYRYRTVLRLLEKAAQEYQRMKQENGVLNFQDLLLLAAGLLRDKPNIRTYFRRRFSHVLVDEFQDTDPVQAEVMLLLTADDPHEPDWRKCRSVSGSLFVVGDPKQSIYRFRRADIVTYNEVRRIIENTHGKVLRLTTNFRTIPPILEWANSVFQDRFAGPDNPYSPEYVDLEPGREPMEVVDRPPIAVLEIPDDYKQIDAAIAWEAEQIAGLIDSSICAGAAMPRSAKELAAGVAPRARPSDFLIVTRGRKHLSQYAAALRARGIPHEVTGGTGLNETRDLALLRDCLVALTRPDDPVALLAALRGELFGLSDVQLYQFHRAGGEFRFHSSLPEGLETETHAAFSDAYTRLQQYTRWIHALPAVAAVERILDDLGLMALAAARLGGKEQAGALAKAVEILRSWQSILWSFSSLVEVIEGLVEQEEKQDAISIRPDITDVVRIMNLHKVKGLEAPVVFLADPSGKRDHAAELHVTRSGERVLGYLAVRTPADTYGNSQVLAEPVGWEGFEEEEQRFRTAEETRLLYVAATRAGAQLVVTLRMRRENENPWSSFKESVAGLPRLPQLQTADHLPPAIYAVSGEACRNAAMDIARRWENSAAATYGTRAAKQLSKSSQPTGSREGGLGPEWGSAIHALLEIALKCPEADLHTAAQSQLREHELEQIEPAVAVDVVQSVCKSEIWVRAQQSLRCLPEVPFEILQEGDGGTPCLLRGQIDLIFEEADGWVIVDYKTDHVTEKELPALAEYYRPQIQNYTRAWEAATGTRIKESGLYFTTAGRYVRVEG